MEVQKAEDWNGERVGCLPYYIYSATIHLPEMCMVDLDDSV